MPAPEYGPSEQVHIQPGFLPREHGATAMLVQPFLCAVILVRTWNWALLAAFFAIALTLAVKEPLIVLARQRFSWRLMPATLLMPLKQIGPQALALSVWFGMLVIVGLW